MLNIYPTNGMNAWSGYGRIELGLVRSLHEAGIETRLWPNPDWPVLLVGNPLYLRAPHIANMRRFVYTMSESTMPSRAWIDILNEEAAGVIVPTPDLLPYYRAAGLKIPMTYVPLGVDLYKMAFLPRKVNGVFNFMTYSLGDNRKGAELVMMAFKRLFDGDSRFQLLIKARDGYKNTWLVGLDDPQMRVIGGIQTETEWQALLYEAHCFVFPSRGEGFGLPPREAVLSGCPTIATQWLGMWDADRWALPLSVKEMRVCQFDCYEANERGALWAEPDPVALERHMAWVVDNYPEAQRMTEAGKRYLLDNFTWKDAIRQIMEFINDEA